MRNPIAQLDHGGNGCNSFCECLFNGNRVLHFKELKFKRLCNWHTEATKLLDKYVISCATKTEAVAPNRILQQIENEA